MKKTITLLLTIFTFSGVFARINSAALEPSIGASAVITSVVPGQLNISLTITNTGDEPLIDIQLSAPSNITFSTYFIPILGIGQSVTIDGTRPFTACVYSGNLFVSAMTFLNTPVSTFLDLEYTAPQAAAPQITSVITANCTSEPVNGNMQITLTGLPAGNWTLHGTNADYTLNGTGTSVVLNLDAATIVGNGIRFYYDTPNGCPSNQSEFVTRNELHNFDPNAPMIGTYVDANHDGITNVGDEILYQVMVTNTRSCPINVAINGFAPSFYNFFLSFSGNQNIAVDVPGYTTLAVPATYMITPLNISSGYVYNATSVNPHWPGTSAMYTPSCITPLTILATNEVAFQNFTSYPNPIQNVWHIVNGVSIDKIEIMTMLGQYVETILVKDLSKEIDLSKLSSGTYIARVYVDNQVKAVKIIKS